MLTIVGLTTDHDLITQVSRLLWALGTLLAVRGIVLARWRLNPGALTAAADAGDLNALRVLAMTARIRDGLEEAERPLRRAAEAGDVESMWEMGRLVENRDGLPASEPWFRMRQGMDMWWPGRCSSRGTCSTGTGTIRCSGP
ncbi:sel1 repeat family protein [Streptomyces sp. NPDC127117]|uniref:sel1 repeat family protein n=1 Tax=Streptomyces sp. NPDC127117 TaxID=3345368 RepID=UPI00362F3AFC